MLAEIALLAPTTKHTVVQEALDLVSTGRTVVIIAHRLSTIKHVENIVVMEASVRRVSGWPKPA